MRCLPALTLESDLPFWVSKSSFFAFFDQADFLCRDQEAVVPAYHRDWFWSHPDGISRFMLPTVGVCAGRTQFISGRHRTAVLLPYLDELPIAFAVEHLGPEAMQTICTIPKRELFLSELLELPNLPMMMESPNS